MLGLWMAAAPAPAAPPESARRLGRFGVTWTFDREYPVGTFVNGDPWVVGRVRIVQITPASEKLANGRVVNGSMVNPRVHGDSGFDSLAGGKYRPELNVAWGLDAAQPLTLPPGSSLLSAVSAAGGDSKRPLETIAVLTVLDAPPPGDAFRPPYAAGDKAVRFRFAQVDAARLPRLKVVGTPPAWERVNALVERPFVDFAPNWNRYHIATAKNGALYGRDTSQQVSLVTAMLIADYPPEEKRSALIGLIQRGIDLYGLFTYWSERREQCPFPWNSDGGHSSGRKWPIVFAGAMLGDEAMTRVGHAAPGRFHEDAQTVYITAEHVALTNSDRWRPPYDGKHGKQPYTERMIGMPEWVGNRNPEQANAHWTGHPYRLGGNQHAFHGMTLGVLAMGLREAWNHDAWFDYQARYTAILEGRPDPFAEKLGYEPVEGSRPAGGFPGWQKFWQDRWPYDLWNEHWKSYWPLPDRSPAAANPNTAGS